MLLTLTRPSRAVGVAGILLLASVSAANAAINQIALFRVGSFSQTSSAAPTVADSYFYNARIFVDSGSDFDGAILTYPGPASPGVYSAIPDTTEPAGLYFSFSGPSEPNRAALDADFPTGAYVSTAANSVTSASQTSAINYTVDAYSTTVPAVTPASYTALQGANAAAPLVVNFAPFVPDAGASESDIFFSIIDPLDNTVFNEGFLTAATPSVTIPANTLAPDTAYTFSLTYSDRINSNKPDGVFDVLGFDFDTNGAFTTAAAPEPASLVTLALAAPVLLRKRRRHERP